MSCDIKRADDGRITEFRCGPEPKPTDHECDNRGPFKEIESGMGTVHSATCSMCGRPAFNSWDIW
ncbi:MAG: hypothetical protein WCV99_13445 [Sterolibacterium sp.]|jgi:hypothetical protein